jgi:hypothetical protein
LDEDFPDKPKLVILWKGLEIYIDCGTESNDMMAFASFEKLPANWSSWMVWT